MCVCVYVRVSVCIGTCVCFGVCVSARTYHWVVFFITWKYFRPQYFKMLILVILS